VFARAGKTDPPFRLILSQTSAGTPCLQRHAKWLGEVPATNDELKALLVPLKDDALIMWPVNRQKIGNVRNKNREMAEPEALEALSGS
jgi:hypothetical protein